MEYQFRESVTSKFFWKRHPTFGILLILSHIVAAAIGGLVILVIIVLLMSYAVSVYRIHSAVSTLRHMQS